MRFLCTLGNLEDSHYEHKAVLDDRDCNTKLFLKTYSNFLNISIFVFFLQVEKILQLRTQNAHLKHIYPKRKYIPKMSFSRGDCQRKRAQKHQNKTVFKNDLHDNSDRTKQLNSMSINEVCKRCSDIIQWKIQYRKYKALTKPAACNICKERKVKKGEKLFLMPCAFFSNFTYFSLSCSLP